jgi:hypothetical protein
MLLACSLPAFAQIPGTTDVIPIGGKWESLFREEQPFDNLQAACEFDFNILWKDQKSDTPCHMFRLSSKKAYLPIANTSFGLGVCYIEIPKIEYETINGKRIKVCTDSIEEPSVLSLIEYTPTTCPAPANGQRAAADCTQNVSLTPAPGQTEPRPKGSEGGDGKSTYDLIAKVTEGNQPKAGMALTFTAEVEPGSGNHPLNPPKRPPGILSVTSGTTNASGEVKVTFTSPIFSGTHKVKVSCAKCTGTVKEDTEIINVKVPNLSSFPADTKVPARWNFIGTDKYHNQERFYLTDTAILNLKKLIEKMQAVKSDKTGKLWGIVGLNDANLPWGGRYNAYNPDSPTPYRWNAVITNGFHEGHRLGVEIDIRTSDKSSDKAHVTKAFNEVCKDPSVTAKILHHYDKGPHFHTYLLGNVDKKLGGSACWQSAK